MDNLSIYIHWPFCLSKCPYCDFNSHVSKQIDHDIWLKSYEKEIDYFQEIIANKYIKSIFFGGGTPSLMKAYVVEGIINRIRKFSKIDHNTEISLETNPTSFEANKFHDFKQAGINRISIGVQSLRTEGLKQLGRNHSLAQTIYTIETAHKLFSKISFDLIYGRSNQVLKEWKYELQEAMQLASGHISLYQLTIEKGTLFYKLFKENNLLLPNSDSSAEMYEWTTNYLESKKYHRYEISNYAILGQECLHNLTYWNYNSYLGIGPGAHSRIIQNTYPITAHSIVMHHKPEKWLQAVNTQNVGIQLKNQLSLYEIIEEIFMMGLRLQNGLHINTIEQRIQLRLDDMLDIERAEHYKNLGLLKLDEYIQLTSKGLMLHNHIVPRIIKIQ